MTITLNGTSGITTPGVTNTGTQSITGAVTLSSTLQGASTISVGGATPSASGAGITFPASQSASTNANTLDDYEEGTYTPVPSPEGGSITTYSASGSYVKVGNLVQVAYKITLTTVGTASGKMYVTLPFASTSFSRPFVAVAREDNVNGVVYGTFGEVGSVDFRIGTLTNGAISWTNGYAYTGSISYQSS